MISIAYSFDWCYNWCKISRFRGSPIGLSQPCPPGDKQCLNEQTVEEPAADEAPPTFECVINSDGSGFVTTTKDGEVLDQHEICKKLKLQGFDEAADLLPGGIDGIYSLMQCQNNRPSYAREGSGASKAAGKAKASTGHGRWLSFNSEYDEWDIATQPQHDMKDVAVFGMDDNYGFTVKFGQPPTPVAVPSWFLRPDLSSSSGIQNDSEGDFIPIADYVVVTCLDGGEMQPN
eukprot:gene8131-8325_t